MTSSTTLRCYLDEKYAVDPARDRPLAPDTLAGYRTDLGQVNKFVRESREEPKALATLGDLSRDFVLTCRQWKLAHGVEPATANKIVRTLLLLWSHAADAELLPPPPKIKPLHEPKRVPIALTMAEVDRLLNTAERWPGMVGPCQARDWWPALLLFVLSTGFRIRSVLLLPTSHLGDSRVLVPDHIAKQRNEQHQDLSPEAIAALNRIDPRGRGLDTVFGDWLPHAGIKHRLRKLWDRYRELVHAAGLGDEIIKPTCGQLFHRLRKTFGTQVAASGGMDVARELLGHSSMEVTKRYIDPRMMGTVRAVDHVPLWRKATDEKPNIALFDPEGLAVS